MHLFEKIIRKQQVKQNSVIILKYLLLILLLIFIVFNTFFVIYSFSRNHQIELFVFALCLKIFLVFIFFYFVFLVSRLFLNKFKAAKFLDEFNNDTSDTYQNALELKHYNVKTDPAILELIYKKTDEKAKEQIVKPDYNVIKPFIIPVLLILLFSVLLFNFNSNELSEAYGFFKQTKLPPVKHKEFVEVEPGDLSITRNQDVEIKVINPEPEVDHSFFYKIENIWREERLHEYKKKFHNLDFSFAYFIETPFARSDTFKITVYEIPAIKNIDVKYDYPEYTGLQTEFEQNSSGNIKALKNTFVTLMVEANNPIETARILFSDGNLNELERLGKSSFKTSFKVEKNGYYHISLEDILDNKSKKINKSITSITDRKPDIKIIYPGKDTLLTQNMLLPLKIYASDDYGLKNCKLKYFVNSGEIIELEIRRKISENILNLEYTFDLDETYLIPGDRVTYWVEIFDNSPQQQIAVSRRYVARFPSIEEIYQEIEREEKAKSEILQTTLEKSKELQGEYEEKRREMMKKDEFDWEDKKALEEFLKKQENLNKDIEKVAEDYHKLLEKFEDNKALSRETLEKMEKIKELMEEISSDELREAMEKLRENLEDLDPEVMRKAMENFKFSMEDFSEKLEQTIKLLEDIKKEQALQKSLEIAKEMEEMQEKLNERTENQEADNEQLACEQQNIADKLEALEKQLQETAALLDERENKDVLEALKELQEQMEQDSLAEDLQESMENLQQNQMQKAQSNQKCASQKMQKITQSLSSMQQMMSSCSMMQIGEILDKTIKRLLIFSFKHENSAKSYNKDPFLILPDQIAIFEGIGITLQKLYSTPMIILALGPKFIYDANFTTSNYRELFQHINDAKKHKVKAYLKDIQKGMNLMIFDLMQSKNNMQQGGGGGGMQSLMQALQQMGQQQMLMMMITEQLFQQIGEDGRLSRDMMGESQRLAREEQRLAENLKRLLQNNPEAQKQTSALNKIIEDLESISRNLQRGRIDQALIDQQERILSRLLDAQKSIHKREFSKKRKAELSEIEDWELPEEVKLKFDKMRQKALLNEDYKDYPKEYQELIKEYLKLLNEKANEENN